MLRKTLIVLAGAIGTSAVVMAPNLASADGNGTGPGWATVTSTAHMGMVSPAKRLPAKRTGREIFALAVSVPGD